MINFDGSFYGDYLLDQSHMVRELKKIFRRCP